MEPRLYFENLSYDGIGDFVAAAVEKSDSTPLYLLGKAAAYVDVAVTLGRITRLEATELRTMIAVYAGMADPKPFEYWEAR